MTIRLLALIPLILIQLISIGKDNVLPKIRFEEEKDIQTRINQGVREVIYTVNDTMYQFEALEISVIDTSHFLHFYPISFRGDSVDLVNFRQVGNTTIFDSLVAYVPSGNYRVFDTKGKPICKGELGLSRLAGKTEYITVDNGIDDVEAWLKYRDTDKYYNSIRGQLPNSLETGSWEFYRPDGSIKEAGSFSIELTIDTNYTMNCYTNEPIITVITYPKSVRVGEWIEYTETGLEKWKGRYEENEWGDWIRKE